jgi:NADH:ubiquinone oxidoreductase subunit 5 (subunit L)/multisubunit Na+/H+ antiporter MnhA subunit
MLSLRIGIYILAFFHLLTHALFKASLFLRAGKIIHFYGGRQDIRHLSGVRAFIPLTSSCMFICSLALRGFPFLAAFYSKDKIIEEILSGGYSLFRALILVLSVAFTSFYRFRLISHAFGRPFAMRYELNCDKGVIVSPIVFLTAGGIMGGRLLR